MPNLYPLLRPALRRLPPETARNVTVWALEAGLGHLMLDRASQQSDPPILAQRLWGLDFPNPIGLAAGYDKDARVAEAVRRFGFGFVEVGTVTPRAQPGNQKPRVFRLEEDQAIINRMGFNSRGLDAVVNRLSTASHEGVFGINLGSNRDSSDAAADYVEGVRRTASLADYLVVNVSSPNTPGLRALQRRHKLKALLRQLLEARAETGRRVPLLVKIAPDLTAAEREDIATIALECAIDGLIVSNTTVERPVSLVSPYAQQPGGLSGRPLFAPSTALLADIYRLTRGRLPLIGVGGIADAADAYTKIRVGASLVQLYTALVFEGPSLIGRIKQGLAQLLRRDGFSSITEAVGTGSDVQPIRDGASPLAAKTPS
ncbi:MAG TPA: quinone-dependent dihydroorotate dehydrogenase [Stellaceae bacterium]|nr:quinone-dependent dihydroorotate dehydrogenase [Stellaceae bacterium]